MITVQPTAGTNPPGSLLNEKLFLLIFATRKRNEMEIIESNNRGGKAGRGFNKTKTIQVIERYGNGYYSLIKQFKFYVGDILSKKQAIEKANKYILSQAGITEHYQKTESELKEAGR